MSFSIFSYICTVRPLSLILAIFFAFLLTAPCGDVSARSKDRQSTVQHDKNSEKQQHSDNCTPFCTCNCCGAQLSVVSVKLLIFPEDAPIYSEKINSYHSLFQPGIPSGIWQPPQLG
uniref:DUF6660 family protein n=1 Tax=Kaistella palustris TaxID=493376 RepID=UPI00373FC89A